MPLAVVETKIFHVIIQACIQGDYITALFIKHCNRCVGEWVEEREAGLDDTKH